MRKASGATVAMIMGVALYFTLFWGYDALRVLTSPTYGLEDVWRSQFVFGVGAIFHLAPMGLIKLAAFFGAVKLAVAIVCAVHLVDRLRTLAGGTVRSDILEGGLIAVVAVSLVAIGPAVWSHNDELVRSLVLQLALAALATALSAVERSYNRDANRPVNPASRLGLDSDAPIAIDASAVAAAPRLHA
ncbi:MAG: hypothetical protein GC182_23515 [Rhodopseudomonas sp.]|nr:hypothetical protein [Rhodopseudomonas sp.]